MRARIRPFTGVAAVAAYLTLVACRPGTLGSTVAEPPPPPPVTPVSNAALAIATDGPTLPPAPRAPWIALTASDGTGLTMTSLAARAVIEGPLAFTELHMIFENPRPRVLEGTFKVVLPVGASVSRFAMRIGEQWQEGEVVERQRAHVAYEDFLHRKQDPALLETSAGNELSARVFPIPAGGTKEIIISYAEEMRGAAPYTLPLRGLPQVAQVDASVSAAGSNLPLSTLSRSGWTPDSDFVVDRSAEEAADGLRSADLAVFRVHPVAEHHPEPIGSAVVLIDTSASRALDLAMQVRRLREVAAAVARTQPDATWSLACFDQSVDEVFTGPVKAIDDAVLARIAARGALGASDFGKAFAWAAEKAPHLGAHRVLLLSDGVATAGDTDRAKIVADAHALSSAGVERVDALSFGGIRDDGALHAIATAGLAHDGLVLSDADDARTATRRLAEGTRSGVAVTVDGAAWSYPRRLDGVQAGDEVLVYAQLSGDTPVQVSVGGVKQTLKDVRQVERPLLERAWTQAKIASLVDSEATADDVDAVRRQVVELSTSHRVLSPYTALLVLETERDYARFGIGHTALAEVLAVQGSRVVLTHRSGAAIVVPEKRAVARTGNAQWGMVGLVNGEGNAARSAAPSGAAPTAAASAAPDTPAATSAPREEEVHAKAAMFGEATAASAGPGTMLDMAAAQPIGESFGGGGLGLSGRGVMGGGGGGGGGARARDEAPRPAPMPQAAAARPMAAAAAPPPAPAAPVLRRAWGPRGDDAVLGLSDERAMPQRPEPPAGAAAGPYAGRFAEVMGLLAHKDAKRALDAANAWHSSDPGDVMGLVALGESLEATGDKGTAERAYGSIIDLYPSRADLRRMAGERLDRIEDSAAADFALDTYRKALEERPDHPSSHRLLAYALLRRGLYSQAFDAALDGLAHHYPEGRFLGVEQVLREDLGLVGAAWAHAEPERRSEILGRVRAAGGVVESDPSLRFVLTWETDANDVDLHVRDTSGEEAFYSHPTLASGGQLVADVTTGYGPECFTVRLPKNRRSHAYSVRAHYYSRGPMGYGMGKLEVVEHDGHGGLTFRERPFVVMNDQAYVELGQY
jgi:hypothetical protein